MIRDILKGLFIENLSFSELSQRLDTSPESLRDMLHNMEHMGYIREVCEEAGSIACPGTCACTASEACRKGATYPSGKKYILTEKGERMCCKE